MSRHKPLAHCRSLEAFVVVNKATDRPVSRPYPLKGPAVACMNRLVSAAKGGAQHEVVRLVPEDPDTVPLDHLTALAHLRYSGVEDRNGVFMGRWRDLDDKQKQCVDYLCAEYDYAFEEVGD